MNVEVLYFEGCPACDSLLPRLRRIISEHGGHPDQLKLRAVETPEAAEAARFLGSPTVRVNGRDVDPDAVQRRDFGLKCRLYRTEHGQSPLPPDALIRAAIADAETAIADAEVAVADTETR